MGNSNKKNKAKKESEKPTSDTNIPQSDIDESQLDESQKILKVNLQIVNKQVHSNKDDKIEEVLTIPELPDSIIIGCRSGSIKEISKVSSFHQFNEKTNIKQLYNCLKRLYSLILINKNKYMCAGLENEIVILKMDLLNLNKVKSLTLNSEGPINSLLELNNGNIISAGKNIILWKKQSSIDYNQVESISIEENFAIINLVEFPFFNTILATQMESHIIYFLKNEGNSIKLVKKCVAPSIWYKGSAQALSKNIMLLVGKFELNTIDAKNGDVISRYPGIDRGSLLKMNITNKNFWVVSDFYGRYFEFYEQEDNDLIFYERVDLKEDEYYKWGNKLTKINDECFVATNHYGWIVVYKIINIS